jgi:hypothetical protein
MRKGEADKRGALRPEFEELVDLLELIGLLELNVEVCPTRSVRAPFQEKMDAA